MVIISSTILELELQNCIMAPYFPCFGSTHVCPIVFINLLQNCVFIAIAFNLVKITVLQTSFFLFSLDWFSTNFVLFYIISNLRSCVAQFPCFRMNYRFEQTGHEVDLRCKMFTWHLFAFIFVHFAYPNTWCMKLFTLRAVRSKEAWTCLLRCVVIIVIIWFAPGY